MATKTSSGFGSLKRARPEKAIDESSEKVAKIISKADDEAIGAPKEEPKTPAKKAKTKDILLKISEDHHRRLALIAERLSEDSFSRVSQRGVASKSLEKAIDDLASKYEIS